MTIESGVPIQAFGDRLIETRDLDPTYVGLVGADLPHPQLCRWLLSYWCFYHVGVACFMSEKEGTEYWKWMEVAARNEAPDGENASFKPHGQPSPFRWPRAAERRHFRGQKCVDAVRWLSSKEPETRVSDLRMTLNGPAGVSEKIIMEHVQRWPMFGPWIAFKAADMLERCAGVTVRFSPDSILMYEEPRKALDLLAYGPEQSYPVGDKRPLLHPDRTPDWWYRSLLTYYASRPAPPSGDRMCGPQEVETVLCKYKSMVGGHYHVGKDIHDHRAALAGWGETADRMLLHMPMEVSQ